MDVGKLLKASADCRFFFFFFCLGTTYMNIDSQSRKQPTEEHTFSIQFQNYKEFNIFFLFSGYFLILNVVTMFGSMEMSQHLGMSSISLTKLLES